MVIAAYQLSLLALLSCTSGLGQVPGAAADAIAVYDANMKSGQNELTTSNSRPFNCLTDVGKAIAVYAAGQRHPEWGNILGDALPLSLVTTITSCQATNAVTLKLPAAYTVTNVAMVFGTDDHNAVQACVNAAANGGRCTFPAGKSFMISNDGQNVTIPSGATIDGSGMIYYAPQGTITEAKNDTLFGVNEKYGTNISYPFRIAAPIRKGQTYFSAYNNSDIDASRMAVNVYVEVQQQDTELSNSTYIDWMQIQSIVPDDALVEGTYQSGITAVGSPGQTCTLTRFNGAMAAMATVELTGTNKINDGTALFVRDGGTGATGMSTSASAGSGTANCSGTAIVATKLGTTVNTTSPFRMSFPGTTHWCSTGGRNGCSGLGWRTVLTPAHGLVIKDIYIVVPPVASATRATRAFDIKGARGTLIQNTHILQGGVLQDLEEEFNQGTHVVGNMWTSEAGGVDLTESVDGFYEGNTFDHRPTPWNGWQSPCAATTNAGGHVDLEVGLGWFHFILNSIPHPCYVGMVSFFGNHDGEIGGNTIGRVSGDASFSTGDGGISAYGSYRVLIHDNTLAGAEGSASIGLSLRDFVTGKPPIYSDHNLIWGNHISGFAGGAYDNISGVLGTDCYYAYDVGESSAGTTCPKILPFMMNPEPGSRLSSTSPTFNWSSGPGVSVYELCLGSADGKCNLFKMASATALSMTATNLPSRGTIYARLYYKIDGAWQYRSYVYVGSGHRGPIMRCRPEIKSNQCKEEISAR
jgi:hypothetical protein